MYESPSPNMNDNNKNSKPTVFISYSHNDEEFVRDYLLTNLEKNGIPCHIDFRDFELGKASIICMEEAVEKCDKTILVYSKNWLGSEFSQFEGVMLQTESPLNFNKKIIPIMIEKCDIPRRLKILNYANFTDKSKRDTQLERVIKQIKNDLKLRPEKKIYPVLDDCHIDIVRLPPTGFELFDRQKELVLLNEAWKSETTNIVSFVAYGGVGKSTLIYKWIEKMRWDNFRGAEKVYAWSFYSQGTNDNVTSADVFINTALKWFGHEYPKQESPRDKGKRLAKLINKSKTLLVLDGLEPLQSGKNVEKGKIKDAALETLLRELAKHNKGLCIITTREHVFELNQYINTTKQLDLEHISNEAGRKLLEMRRIQGTGNELELIVRKFGNHALAINLLAEYLRIFDDHPVKNANTVPELDIPENEGKHARRVIEAFSIQFKKDSPEYQLLLMLGLFDRPVPIKAINAIIDNCIIKSLTDKIPNISGPVWFSTLKNLRKHKLIFKDSDHSTNTIDCHPLIREHFGEKLKNENPDAWVGAHSSLYEYYKELPEKEFPDTLDEMESLFLAVAHGCTAGKYQEAMNDVYWERIQRKTEYYSLKKLGAFGSDLAALSGFFEIPWKKPSNGLTDDFKTDVLGIAGFTLRALGRIHEAVQPIKAGLEASIKQENWTEAATDAVNLSELYLTMGDLRKAVDYGEKSVKFADTGGDEFWRIVSRTALADAMYRNREIVEAENLFIEAEFMQKKWQPKYQYLYSLRGFLFCELLLEQGKYQDVLERTEKTIQIAVKKKDLLSIALDNLSLGRVYLFQALDEKKDDFRLAQGYFDKAVDGLRIAGRQDHISRGLLSRSALFREKQEYEHVQADLDEAFEIAESGGMILHLVDYFLESVRLNLAMDENEKAHKNIESAKDLVIKTGYYRRSKDVEELSKLIKREV